MMSCIFTILRYSESLQPAYWHIYIEYFSYLSGQSGFHNKYHGASDWNLAGLWYASNTLSVGHMETMELELPNFHLSGQETLSRLSSIFFAYFLQIQQVWFFKNHYFLFITAKYINIQITLPSNMLSWFLQTYLDYHGLQAITYALTSKPFFQGSNTFCLSDEFSFSGFCRPFYGFHHM